jgi:hypothetical protein
MGRDVVQGCGHLVGRMLAAVVQVLIFLGELRHPDGSSGAAGISGLGFGFGVPKLPYQQARAWALTAVITVCMHVPP